MPRRRILTSLIAAALLVGACGGGDGGADAETSTGVSGATGEIDRDGTFRYIFVQNPSTLDPHRSTNPWDMIFFRLAYDQLIWKNQSGDLEPMLATEWEFVDDGAAFELALREDVTFIDGEPFDAEAVRENLERAMSLPESAHRGSLARVESVEAVEEHRVRVNLSGPGGNLPDLFSSTVGSMISPAALDNPDLDQNPVGSGMAKLVEYIPGQVNRWERNEDYWDPEAAQAKTYEIYAQTASPTRVNMLAAGQGELTYLMPQDQESAEAAGLTVAPSLSTTIFSLYLNAGKEGLDDPLVREAIEHAVDRQGLIDGVFFGAGKPLAQMLPPDHWAYHAEVTPDNTDYGYDPEKARELLAEAGHADGLELEMIIPSLDDHRALAEALVPMLAEVGITVSSRVVESPTTAVTFFSRQEGDFYPGAGAPIVDPTNQYQRNLPGQFANPWENTSEEFVEAWNASLEGTSREERLPGVHAMIEQDKELRNVIPIMLFTPPSAWSDNVVLPEGYVPAYAPHFRGVGVTGD
ncbi:ABC transporter substrate-binding protein [Ornithinimicrobium sufpigmenti]|uniref:ABC transporter substrate-binding protein n=1 Tax=Ornithinimicrobium sufpigmenti TaxID=2508882 RepID=UPI00103697F2|nr:MULTISPECIES: ABC transporter substrate-binding protein [unclassified Ornithinimicrobium]